MTRAKQNPLIQPLYDAIGLVSTDQWIEQQTPRWLAWHTHQVPQMAAFETLFQTLTDYKQQHWRHLLFKLQSCTHDLIALYFQENAYLQHLEHQQLLYASRQALYQYQHPQIFTQTPEPAILQLAFDTWVQSASYLAQHLEPSLLKDIQHTQPNDFSAIYHTQQRLINAFLKPAIDTFFHALDPTSQWLDLDQTLGFDGPRHGQKTLVFKGSFFTKHALFTLNQAHYLFKFQLTHDVGPAELTVQWMPATDVATLTEQWKQYLLKHQHAGFHRFENSGFHTFAHFDFFIDQCFGHALLNPAPAAKTPLFLLNPTLADAAQPATNALPVFYFHAHITNKKRYTLHQNAQDDTPPLACSICTRLRFITQQAPEQKMQNTPLARELFSLNKQTKQKKYVRSTRVVSPINSIQHLIDHYQQSPTDYLYQQPMAYSTFFFETVPHSPQLLMLTHQSTQLGDVSLFDATFYAPNYTSEPKPSYHLSHMLDKYNPHWRFGPQLLIHSYPNAANFLMAAAITLLQAVQTQPIECQTLLLALKKLTHFPQSTSFVFDTLHTFNANYQHFFNHPQHPGYFYRPAFDGQLYCIQRKKHTALFFGLTLDQLIALILFKPSSTQNQNQTLQLALLQSDQSRIGFFYGCLKSTYAYLKINKKITTPLPTGSKPPNL